MNNFIMSSVCMGALVCLCMCFSFMNHLFNHLSFSHTVELSKVVNQVQNVLGASLDLLIKYGGVWVNYPADHLSRHRLSEQLVWLTSLLQDFSLNK